MTKADRSTQSSLVMQTKIVKWSNTCKQIYITHINDMSSDEIESTWYKKQDYRAFRRDCKNNVHILKGLQTNSTGVDVCGRGLETSIFPEIEIHRRALKELALKQVLIEQSRNWSDKTYAQEFIAEIYEDICGPCQQEAYRKGLQDEEEVRSHRLGICRKETVQSRKLCEDKSGQTLRTPLRPLIRRRKAYSMTPPVA